MRMRREAALLLNLLFIVHCEAQAQTGAGANGGTGVHGSKSDVQRTEEYMYTVPPDLNTAPPPWRNNGNGGSGSGNGGDGNGGSGSGNGGGGNGGSGSGNGGGGKGGSGSGNGDGGNGGSGTGNGGGGKGGSGSGNGGGGNGGSGSGNGGGGKGGSGSGNGGGGNGGSGSGNGGGGNGGSGSGNGGSGTGNGDSGNGGSGSGNGGGGNGGSGTGKGGGGNGDGGNSGSDNGDGGNGGSSSGKGGSGNGNGDSGNGGSGSGNGDSGNGGSGSGNSDGGNGGSGTGNGSSSTGNGDSGNGGSGSGNGGSGNGGGGNGGSGTGNGSDGSGDGRKGGGGKGGGGKGGGGKGGGGKGGGGKGKGGGGKGKGGGGKGKGGGGKGKTRAGEGVVSASPWGSVSAVRRVVVDALASIAAFVGLLRLFGSGGGGGSADTRAEPSSPRVDRRNLCGISSALHSRVVGGAPAAEGSWPWIAALGFSSRHHATVDFLCAGSLVSSRHVVSAAHCFAAEFKLFVVRLGEYDLLSDRGGEHPLDIRPKDVRSHPRYNTENNDNDIAVILLSKDVRFNSRIRPICLPRPKRLHEDLVGTWPYIAGWGAKHFEGPQSNILRELQMPVVADDVCRWSYSNFDFVIIDDRVICAGYLEGGRDACQGDSGGPLMLRYKGRYYLIGVVSLGYRCAEPDLPGVYTRVSTFLDWIDDYMKKNP